MSSTSDVFIGQTINGYSIIRPINRGALGRVYLAEKVDNAIHDQRAIKFIPKCNIRSGWENEISKVTRLRNTDGVVRYQAHGIVSIKADEYLWISWDYIEGISLTDIIAQNKITLQIICDIIARCLQVLHACQSINIQHADLHTGNIIVENSNVLNLNPEQRRIWITDFGYLSASMGKDLLDDFVGLACVVKKCISTLNYAALEGRERNVYNRIKTEFVQQLQETNATEGAWVRSAANLYLKFENILKSEIIYSNKSNKGIGDYLAAELIGDQYDEWKALFVPDFIGHDSLLEKNTTIFTGLRGCGKTMVFRRLTAIYDDKLGPSGVSGADTFLGFYVNSRIVAEAFPWLPQSQEEEARFQVMHFYHTCWCLEILDWLAIELEKNKIPIDWVGTFFSNYFGEKLLITSGGRGLVRHIQAFLNQEIERARLKGRYLAIEWELADIQFLEKFALTMRNNIPSIKEKPVYLFLDDYSTPLVNSTLQHILNPIVFRRSPIVITKIATESIESFEPVGLNGKRLEENNDFTLIDCGVHVLTMPRRQNQAHLAAIFKRRIERVNNLRDKNLDLRSILGTNIRRNTDLARMLRQKGARKELLYYGFEVFCDTWSGNMREMISLFAEMISSEPLDFRISNNDVNVGIVPKKVQDRVLRTAGGRYLSLLSAAINPYAKIYNQDRSNRSFGEQLVKIAKAFQSIAMFELMMKESKNQKNTPPKQPRKIEITDVANNLPEDIEPLYSGLLRYGLFIRDYRGKSVRGKAVPRLFLRGILIPYFTLTFSKRDHVTLNWNEFCNLLRSPDEFAKKWITQDFVGQSQTLLNLKVDETT